MPSALKMYYLLELEDYKKELAQGNIARAWYHLERAHVLGQSWPREHNRVHWLMLKFGIRIKSTREIFGQLSRLNLGGVKSFVGHVPIGNTGGANVPGLKPMPITGDLEVLMKIYRPELTQNSIR